MPNEDEEVVRFDIDTVTVDEAELLEETLGIPWLDCISTKAGTAKVIRGFVWLHKRRTDPDLQLADVHFNIQSFGQELGAPQEGEDAPVPLSGVSDLSERTSTSSSTRSTGSSQQKSAS